MSATSSGDVTAEIGDGIDPALRLRLERWCEAIIARGLQLPVVILLEAHRPLRSLAYSSLELASPLLSAMFGGDAGGTLRALLQDQRCIDYVINRFEQSQTSIG